MTAFLAAPGHQQMKHWHTGWICSCPAWVMISNCLCHFSVDKDRKRNLSWSSINKVIALVNFRIQNQRCQVRFFPYTDNPMLMHEIIGSSYLTIYHVNRVDSIFYNKYLNQAITWTNAHFQNIVCKMSPILLRPQFVSPLRAIFSRGNINIYLHFVSFLHIDTTQVVEILPQIRQEPTYST